MRKLALACVGLAFAAAADRASAELLPSQSFDVQGYQTPNETGVIFVVDSQPNYLILSTITFSQSVRLYAGVYQLSFVSSGSVNSSPPQSYESLTASISGAGSGTPIIAPSDTIVNVVGQTQTTTHTDTFNVTTPGPATVALSFVGNGPDCSLSNSVTICGIRFDGSSVDLTLLSLNSLFTFLPPTAPANARNVAQVVDPLRTDLANFPAGFLSLYGLSGAALVGGLTQLSGETAVGAQQTTFDAMKLFMGLLTDPFLGDHGVSAGAPIPYANETMAYSATRQPRDALAAIYRKAPVLAPRAEPRWSVWTAGYGGSQTTDGNAAPGSNTTTSRVYGTAVGADYRFSPPTIAGFAVAGGGTNFAIANGGGGRSDLFQAGAFFRHNNGPAYLTGALAYGWQDITTDRTVTLAGIDQLRARYNANTYSGRLEGGYRIAASWAGLTPYAAGQFTTFELPSYAENAASGLSALALAYGGKSVTDPRSELGLRSDTSFAMTDGLLTLRGRAAWAHDYSTDRNLQATFQTLPGSTFVVNGASAARDAALLTASAEMKYLSGLSLAGTFEGEFSGVTRSYAGKGIVRYAW